MRRLVFSVDMVEPFYHAIALRIVCCSVELFDAQHLAYNISQLSHATTSWYLGLRAMIQILQIMVPPPLPVVELSVLLFDLEQGRLTEI